MRPMGVLLLAAGALVLAPLPIRADVPGYKVQSIVKSGDTIGDLKIRADGDFEVDALNDSGQIAFITENAAGGDMLIQYNSSDGKFTPIAAGGLDAPGGKWPPGVGIGPAHMNQQGDMVFAIDGARNTYRWDHQSGQVSIVAAVGMPAVNDLTFTTGSDDNPTPAINDSGEVAFETWVKDGAGETSRALFFLGRDGKLVPVVLPGQTVPGVGAIQLVDAGGVISLNNAGLVGFAAQRPGDESDSVFVWENGTITPVVLAGADAPGGGKFALLGGGLVNSKNRNVLLFGILDGGSVWGIYGLIGGHIVAVAVPGQEMLGGGKYIGISAHYGYASSAGETPFLIRLEGGDTGVYRVDADGKPSLIVKGSDLRGTLFYPLGTGSGGQGLNAKGQVALPVRFTGDKVDTLVLLTPTSP